MIKEISKLDNNIEYIYKQNENTPRIAFCLNLSANKAEEKPGIYSLMARLLSQGTKNYNSEELANEFEKYAIEFSINMFPDYLRIRCLCLNEDFEKAIELLNDVLTNSTFEKFEKERTKLKFEIPAQLDSPKTTALDDYCEALFKDHYYGNSSLTRNLESIDSITKEEVVEAYDYILNNSKKTLSIVGAIANEKILPLINSTIGKLPPSVDRECQITKPTLEEQRLVEKQKSDLNQAHILKGWMVPSWTSEEYYPLLLLNIILGASGLSSRLFLELRDKKGLAYVVRSSYENFKLAANFMIYIATEPGNLETCLKGFEEEITKIKTELVSEKELEDAKNSLIGRYAFLEETNIQQASTYAKYGVLGLGCDFLEDVKTKIQSVTVQDLQACAQKYFNDNFVVSIIKP
ncbi:MAG: insulinase family protein [Muribaculaceae bacterium]|nr:insulinase family protein [Muribaculaceae bacterium]